MDKRNRVTCHMSHIAVDTDTWHRRMGSYRPHALKQPAEELATGMNDIDRSGTPSEIGYISET